MVLRYATVVLVAAFLATVVALSATAVKPERADAVPTYTIMTCDGGTIALEENERRALTLHNHTRINSGLAPLCVDPALTAAARAHSANLIATNTFGHGAVGARLTSHGYSWSTFGENVGGGSGDFARPINVFEMWMGSPGHHANIMNGNFQEIGIGTATGAYRGMANYTMYTVDFAVPAR